MLPTPVLPKIEKMLLPIKVPFFVFFWQEMFLTKSYFSLEKRVFLSVFDAYTLNLLGICFTFWKNSNKFDTLSASYKKIKKSIFKIFKISCSKIECFGLFKPQIFKLFCFFWKAAHKNPKKSMVNLLALKQIKTCWAKWEWNTSSLWVEVTIGRKKRRPLKFAQFFFFTFFSVF